MPITLLLVWVWFQFSTKKSSASWWNCLFRRGIGGTEDRRCKHDIFWLLWSDFWHSELDGKHPCEVQFSYPKAPTNDTLTWKCAEYTNPFTLMHFQFHLQLKGTGRTFVLRTTQSMEESHTTQVYTNTCCIYTRFVYTAWYTFDKYIYIYTYIVNMVYIQPDFAFCSLAVTSSVLSSIVTRLSLHVASRDMAAWREWTVGAPQHDLVFEGLHFNKPLRNWSMVQPVYSRKDSNCLRKRSWWPKYYGSFQEKWYLQEWMVFIQSKYATVNAPHEMPLHLGGVNSPFQAGTNEALNRRFKPLDLTLCTWMFLLDGNRCSLLSWVFFILYGMVWAPKRSKKYFPHDQFRHFWKGSPFESFITVISRPLIVKHIISFFSRYHCGRNSRFACKLTVSLTTKTTKLGFLA